MDIVTVVLQWGAVATAITAICVLTSRAIKFFKSIYTFIHNLEVDNKKLLRRSDEQYKAILRLTITADHMPMSERLLAGKEYVEELNGNGEVKALYKELKRQCDAATNNRNTE